MFSELMPLLAFINGTLVLGDGGVALFRKRRISCTDVWCADTGDNDVCGARPWRGARLDTGDVEVLIAVPSTHDHFRSIDCLPLIECCGDGGGDDGDVPAILEDSPVERLRAETRNRGTAKVAGSKRSTSGGCSARAEQVISD